MVRGEHTVVGVHRDRVGVLLDRHEVLVIRDALAQVGRHADGQLTEAAPNSVRQHHLVGVAVRVVVRTLLRDEQQRHLRRLGRELSLCVAPLEQSGQLAELRTLGHIRERQCIDGCGVGVQLW